MTRLVVTADAERDITAIFDYLAAEAGSNTAANYAELFRATIARLIDFPGSGSPRPALGPETRIAIVYPYILIYDYIRGDDELVLQRIIHGKRDITEQLIKSRTGQD
jgi:toxin ParE1/3/4